ncbi:hypothetical protein FOPE_05705 [Fonsecaea pedrosoi]|nr:hypothetical protein FOPE_05705 [Fonsecaea pedrosoi]
MAQSSPSQSHPMNGRAWAYPNTSRSEVHTATPDPRAASTSHGPGRATTEEELVDPPGSCHAHEKDSMCSKNSDGDGLSSTWSSSRSTNLKKRNGQACDGCRERKMRCDFKFPKCTMCKSIDRECTFGSAPRATMRHSAFPMSMPSISRYKITNQNPDNYPNHRGSTTSVDMGSQEHAYSASTSRSSMPLDDMLYATSGKQISHEDVSDNQPPAKRPRVSPSPRPRSQGQLSASSGTESVVGSISSPSVVSDFSWDLDPYQLNRSLTWDYVNKYFEHVDGVTYHILPKELFRPWIRSHQTKSLADKMLLYAILAMGTVFASRQPQSKHHQDVFLEIVNKAIIKNGDMFSLQLIQTKLILGLFAFSQGQYNRASDHCGSALRTALGLRYNTEEGVSTIEGQDPLDLGLSQEMLVECRRRTFWAAYLLDSFSRCWSASVTTVNRFDCHLRLPCAEAAYEAGHVPLAPFILEAPKDDQGSRPGTPLESSEVGSFGYLVEIAAIFSEVMSTVNRGKTQSPGKDRSTMGTFRNDIGARLKTWDYHMKRQALQDQDGRETVSGFYVIYHYTLMVLNRYIDYAEMDRSRVSVCVKRVHDHARHTLGLVQRLREHGDDKHDYSHQFVMLSPFSGFAIIAALDVVTATGPVSTLMGHESQIMSLIGSVVPVLEGLKDHWHSGRQQQEVADRRLRALLRVSSKAFQFNGAYYFAHPMQSRVDMDHDVTYGLCRNRYFEAMGWEETLHHDGEFQRLD